MALDEIFRSGPSGVDRYLAVTDHRRTLEFEIDAPWYGSTEGGFGANLIIDLKPSEVQQLHQALGAWLASLPTTSEPATQE